MRILLIIALVGYVLYKLGIFRLLLGTSMRGQNHFRRPNDGNVNIDSVPPDKQSRKAGFKGGEYVDYEEVK
ncbi:MAG TPA: hypothetical protein VKZ86_10460 [Cyclobacteriaceae bacterium]|jgi:hypothetical protein|nr:DUF4834 family protein [Cyclobacteriaceae bacterium]HLT81443.1 hypothetical protein [Cyclobacteriaceae bacterium]